MIEETYERRGRDVTDAREREHRTGMAEDPMLDVLSGGSDSGAVAQVITLLKRYRRVGIAFSGGVDSSTLLALAARALGGANVVALLGVSPSLAADERRAAHLVADFIGVQVVEVPTHEGANPAYRLNGPDRCFHCKSELFSRIDQTTVEQLNLDAVAYGENADDAKRPDRPGSQAARNYRVLTPLAAAGMGKASVRRVAAALDLPCALKPAAPCLASRIPHFSEVTTEKLAQVEAAEAELRALGFSDSRVRHHGDVARVELPVEDIVRATTVPLRDAIDLAVRRAGFRFVAVDLRGIQSGAFTLPLVPVSHG